MRELPHPIPLEQFRMRICRLAVLCTLLLCVFRAAAQTVRDVLVNEMDGWRVHTGDNLAWASPTFDDSAWTTTSLNYATFPRPLQAGRSRWYRKRISLPDRPGPMQLVIVSYDRSYEVYLNGRLVSPPIQSPLHWRSQVARIVPLRAAGDSSKEIDVAIRSHLYSSPFILDSPPFVLAASPFAAEAINAAEQGELFGGNALPLAVNFLTLIGGLILLPLYLQQRSRREYLWLGITLLLFGLSGLALNLQNYIGTAWNALLGDPCEYWSIAAQIEFVYAFVGRKPHRAVRGYQWALVALPFVLNPIEWFHGGSALAYGAYENTAVFPGMLIAIGMLVAWTIKGNREAAVLIGPMLLCNFGTLLIDIEMVATTLRLPWAGTPSLQLGILRIDLVTSGDALFLLAIGFIIFLRFLRVAREQVAMQSEFEAARAVQHVLIPDALPSVPGFRIDSIYHPAQQVGGDFFQIIPLASGGLLAVVGDVSGKGMPAALTVALIVGALRTLVETTSSPAEILAGLNRRLDGRSTGFTTCVAVRINPNGEATLASAGHLNPYVSASQLAPREIATTAGLPLGLAADSQYTDVALALAPGETITFLSDGVVEARNARGELFGFDRACALAAHPANHIAETAEAFGQEDDITVVTLTLDGAAVPA